MSPRTAFVVLPVIWSAVATSDRALAVDCNNNGVDDSVEAARTMLFVKWDAVGTNTGESWPNAYRRLQDALCIAAQSGVGRRIYVARGTYHPSDAAEGYLRDRYFAIPYGVSLRGGFAGDEAVGWSSYGDPRHNPTILSGDLLEDDGPDFANTSDNSFAVAQTVGGGDYSGCEIDCFEITGAVGGAAVVSGALGQELISYSRCTFAHNRWGAAYDTARLKMRYCLLRDNEGLQTVRGANWLRLECCIFHNNGVRFGGPVLRSDPGRTTVEFCTFWNNPGGAIVAPGHVVANSIIRQCGASPIPDGGFIADITYSDIEGRGDDPVNHNIDADPLFRDPNGADDVAGTDDDDLHLLDGSPCIDRGYYSELGRDFDIEGNRRTIGDGPDMGALEAPWPFDCNGNGIDDAIEAARMRLYVRAGAAGTNSGDSWENAYPRLQDALCIARRMDYGSQIWVAQGTYKPTDGTGGFDRELAIEIRHGTLIGGFSGTETEVGQSDPARHPTILSGDLLGNDGPEFANYEDNSLTVVRTSHQVGSSGMPSLSGFFISGAAASPAIELGYPSEISRCTFLANQSVVFAIVGAGSICTNCVFNHNGRGADDALFDVLPYLAPVVEHCTAVDNPGGFGVAAANSIFVRTPVADPSHVSYSVVSGAAGENRNFEDDPRFVDPDGADDVPGTLDDDFRLMPESPCVDTGRRMAEPDVWWWVNSDYDGNPRLTGSKSDRGAFEHVRSADGNGNGVADSEEGLSGRVYVNPNARGSNSGAASWQDAYTTLDAALWISYLPGHANLEIWISQGTYKPARGTSLPDRMRSFAVRNGTRLIGGFAGDESDPDQRQVWLHPTILSGDLAGNDRFDHGGVEENSQNLLLTDTTVLDGIVFRGAFEAALAQGSGIGVSVLRNCGFVDNVWDTVMSPASIERSVFMRNGGQVLAYSVTNSIFVGSLGNGPLFRAAGRIVRANHCVFLDNPGGVGDVHDVGGRYPSTGRMELTNCILLNNGPTLTGNFTGSYCISDFDLHGNANFLADPRFVDRDGADGLTGTLDDDLRLLANSPAIDAGDPSGVGPATDFDGNPRVEGCRRDIGPFEFPEFDCNGNGVPDGCEPEIPLLDRDGDGAPDCVDGCPDDADKVVPGACGCSVRDFDRDGDGVEDCLDGCPDDPTKVTTGACGCGIPDADRDGDSVADCIDGCPDDPSKVESGTCGCGITETDSDGDGVADCVNEPSDDGSGLSSLCPLFGPLSLILAGLVAVRRGKSRCLHG